MRARIGLLVVPALLAALLGAPPATAAVEIAGCAEADHPGGEWRSYGGDLSNSRSQPLESGINPGRAANLAPARVFRSNLAQPGAAGFSNTPVVADGCVFLATSAGWVFMLNADTLQVVWKRVMTGAGQTLVGGVIVGSPAVSEDGVVFVAVSRPGSPYIAALDAHDGGKVLWTSTLDQSQRNSFFNASPVLFDGMLFQGIAGYESQSDARGAYALVDPSRACSATSATTCANPDPLGTGGKILAKQFTISDAEYAEGYRGASVWCTAAIDPVEKYAYACGGNPASKKLEHRYSNALLKIDVARGRALDGTPVESATVTNPKFGTIVDSYKGETDQYYPGLDRQPACEMFGDQIVYAAWSAACLQLDLDFGSSPNLWRDAAGKLMVGDLQKSGVYHALHADQMQRAWTTIVGAPGVPFNASSAAAANGSVYVVGTPNGTMFGLTQAGGKYRWALPVLPGTHFQSVSTAAGVVYTVDNAGTLSMVDAATGLPVMRRSIGHDAGQVNAAVDAGSQGVAIARNTVYALSGDTLIAYR